MPHRSAKIPCLSCTDRHLELRQKSGLSYHQCDQCQSIWLREPEFLSMMEEVRPGLDNELLVHNDGSERRRCPICFENMDIAWMLFLQMDRCEEHGIWFDPDELDRALSGDDGSEVLGQVDRQVAGRRKADAKLKRERASAQGVAWLTRLRNTFR